MLVDIKIKFKSLSVENGGKVHLSTSEKNLAELIQHLTATNILTVEELTILIIGQLKLCDEQNLNNVLPEHVWKKLISTYESLKNGEKNV
jgi:hypothetical protein